MVGVTALDQDTGLNGRVIYSILGGGSSSSPFVINAATGVVESTQPLTASQAPYTFTVAATDVVSVDQ